MDIRHVAVCVTPYLLGWCPYVHVDIEALKG